MAAPIIKVKRSAVAGKIPAIADLGLGEFAINTYDGKVYIEQDQGAVGVGTTIVVVNPWSVGTGTNTYNTYFTAGNVGVGTTNPGSKLTVNGAVQIQQDSGSNNRLIFRGQPGSSYRWNIDNYSSSNEFRIFREDDATAANGFAPFSISTTGTLTANKFSGDGSLLTNLPGGSGSSQWITTNAGIHTLSNVGIGTTNPTSKLTVSGNASITGTLTADQVYTSNNGNGQNVRIGDDFWLGDVNVADTTRFSGAQDSTRAFVIFGSSDAVSLGRTGTGPLYYGGNFNVAGVITASSFSGNASSATYATSSGIATYATSSGVATYATSSGISTYATTAGISTYATIAGVSTYSTSAGIATYATTSGVSTSVIGGIGSITQLSVSGVITAVTGNFSGIITSSGAIISGVSTVNGKIAAGNGIGNTNLSNTLNYNSSSGITAFRPISLVDSAAGIKISRNSGPTNGAAIELQTWDVGIVTNYSYWDVNAENGYFGIRDRKSSVNKTRLFIDDSGSVLFGATSSSFSSNYSELSGIGTDKTLNVLGKAYISDNVGIGTTNATSKLTVQGNVLVSGVVTATTFVGALTGIAASATQLVTPRTFEITGDVVASAISFDGSGNVSLAATIQPNSVGLGTDTTGDYVRDITGTSNQITVTSGTGEGSTPTLSIPNQFTIPQDATVTRDLQVNRNLNVTGNITLGGTTAFLNVQELKIADPDIVLGVRTDGSGNDISNDNTANHGGIAIASTEGSPLVSLFIAGIETTPATYKKIMWFKSGTFSGLGTDAWLSNYAVGIGSTQFPVGTRLAAGSVQFTERDLSVVRNINASGVGTITSLSGTTATYGTGNFTTGNIVTGVVTTLSGTNLNYTGVGTVTNLTSTNATLTNINSSGISTLGITTFTGAVSFGTSAYFGDNDRAYFGDGNDLEIYHSGTESIINHRVTGDLYIKSINGLYLQTNIGEAAIYANKNAAVELYYDNVKEFETTGYGATVFGTLQSQGLQVNSGVSTLGITTATNLTAQNINNSGITTTNSLNIGATQVISSARQLQNIASLDATTTATIEAAVANAPNTFSDLQVTGISTFTNGPVFIGSGTSTGTASQPLQVTGGAYVSGSVGIGTTNPQKSLHIAGVGTQSGGIRLGDLDFFAFGTGGNSGSPTFRNSQTNGSTTLRVLPNGTGNAQFEFFGTDYFQNTNAWDNIRIVSSSTEFRIDSSYAPAGIAKPIRIETNVSGSGVTFNNPYQLYLDTNGNIGIGTSTTFAKFNVQGNTYVSGSIGIGTTNPTSKLHVVGDTLITGISTLGTVRVSSGIITATSGIVTYYGDGSNLTGIGTISISSTPPSSPSAGRLWYNSDLGRTFIYYNDGNSSQWVDAAPFNFPGISTSTYTETSFIATSGQTTFSVTYDIGFVQVFLNGIRLTSSEYTATTGTSIVLNEAAALGDVIDVIKVATNIGPQGIQGPAGATTLAGVGTTSGSTVHYPVFIAGLGSSESYISTTSNYFSFIPSSGTLSVNQLNIPGISTFSGGPVLIGGGTSTGTASQRLQVTGGGYFSGRVGIGSTNPQETLDVQGGNGFIRIGETYVGYNGITLNNSTVDNNYNILSSPSDLNLYLNRPSGAWDIKFRLANNDQMVLNSSGNLGINSTSPTSRLDVVGDAKVSGVVTATDFNSTSDINLKTNIKPIDDPLEKIIQLNGVSFDWKHMNQSSAGVIAQDVEKVLPEIVRNDVDGYKSLNYNGLIGLLIEAVKEQNETIKSLEQKINTLEGRLG